MLIATIPRYIKNESLRLRPLRITDGPFIARSLRDDDIVRASERPPDMPWFPLYLRIKHLFSCSYCIEHDSKRLGLIGIFDLLPEGYVEMSLTIFEAAARGKGFGTMAFRLLGGVLAKHPFIEHVTVSVRRENLSALKFWTGLGFSEFESYPDIRRLSIDIRHMPTPRVGKRAAASAGK